MSDGDSKPERVYSISKGVAEELIEDCRKKIDFTKSHLKYYVTHENYNPRLISLLCDNYSSNYHMLSEVEYFLENNLVDMEEEGEHIAIGMEYMGMLEYNIVSRIYTENQLNMFNVSVSLN
tara:strand:+ start:210 stop:572 length:363 start_codon:yes stop_codon:yes gene_type:complete